MKKILFIIGILLFVQCDNPADCVKSTGPLVSKTFSGFEFDKILVHKGIALVLKQGENRSITVVSGENLIDDIQVNVNDGLLTLKDDTSCNWVRDYGQTIVYVSAPNLTDIYSKTEQNITSDGILAFDHLHFTSLDTADGIDGAGTGDFILNVQSQNLYVESNNVSRFYLSGTTTALGISFYSGNSTLRAENLLAEKVTIFHRGSNDMFVHPLNEISGDIYNLGNVYAGFRPAIVQVNEHYRGKLIFN